MGSSLNNLLVGFGVAVFLSLSLPAFADTKILNISLKTDENQSFIDLIRQAELTAINSINQEFVRLSTVSKVGITVTGERNGQEVPLLSAKVSRLDWQAQPKIQYWANYFTRAEILLGFNSASRTEPKAPKSSLIFSSAKNDPGFRDD